MKILLTIIFLLTSITVNFAQTKTFKWSSEMCDYQSVYNAKKVSLAQLKDTLKLMKMQGLPLNFDATPQNLDAVDKLNVADLQSEYEAKKREIEGLKLVKNSYFENFRKAKLKELEQVYQLSKVTAEGYKNPQIIKDFDFAPSCVSKYADSLISGGDDLLNIWLEVNKESRKNNSDPNYIRKKYETQLNSPDKFRYARNEVMTFGWWNCANLSIEYVSSDGQAEKEFKKLFVKTKTINCDEP